MTSADKLKFLTHWAHTLTTHTPTDAPLTDNPEELVHLAKQGSLFRCVEYSRVLTAALCANGIPARMVRLKRADAAHAESGAGHVVSEAYVEEQKRWVFLDPQFDIFAVRNQQVQSVADLSVSQRDHFTMDPQSLLSKGNLDEYLLWLRPYLFYIQVPYDSDANGASVEKSLMYVPEHAEPLKVFQGKHPLRGVTYSSDLSALYSTNSEQRTFCH